jgi:hypothetical protein
MASACCHVSGREVPMAAARSSIGRLRSVATIDVPSGRALASRRVSAPVPQQPQARVSAQVRARAARSAAYGSKINGTISVSYNSGTEPAKTVSVPCDVMARLLSPPPALRAGDGRSSF